MPNPILLVSCLFDLDYQIAETEAVFTQRLKHDRRIEWANCLLACDADIVMFCDRATAGRLINNNLRHKIVITDVTSFKTWQLISDNDNLKLPSVVYTRKDTMDFLKLINCKAEMMYQAYQLMPGFRQYSWVDSGIFKLCEKQQDVRLATKLIEHRAREFLTERIVAPGSGSYNYDYPYIVTDRPDWKFLGGFLDVPVSLLGGFYQACTDGIKECLYFKVMTWEVNIWAAVARRFPDRFAFYPADHDMGMFNYYRFNG
jgi:hypothetical protein